MKKEFAILSCVFGLLVGCAETNYPDFPAEKFTENPIEKNSTQPDVHVASRDDIQVANFVLENIFRLSFDEPESQRITTVYNAAREDNCILGSDGKRVYVRCCYLGRLNGKHVIMRAYRTGGTGHFTDIVQCSIEKENLHIDDISMSGDRAFDGIVDCPRLGRDGKLYFKMWTSIDTLAGMAGVSDKDAKTGPSQVAIDFWNVSECIYNLETKRLEIVSMDINFEKPSNVTKILEEIFPNHGKTVRIEKEEMAEFLRKFKSVYLKPTR